jgi:hypothetical protein
MTPDKLPADMEAVVSERLAEIDRSDAGSPCRQAYFSPAVIRALLKAYQEQRRALEEAADSFARIQTYVGGRNIDFVSTFVRAEYGEKRARAALNQKGDER